MDAFADQLLRYMLDKDVIINDLSRDHPQWILSAYGPGKDAPAQLFGGSMREQSFEEMRLYHYQAAAAGNEQQAVSVLRAIQHIIVRLTAGTSRSKKLNFW